MNHIESNQIKAGQIVPDQTRSNQITNIIIIQILDHTYLITPIRSPEYQIKIKIKSDHRN
jgi:hypothetical protein